MTETYQPFVVANDALDKPARLRQMIRDNGYLFLKGVGPREKLLQLREDVLELCDEAGWVDRSAPLMDGKWSGTGPYTEGDPEYMAVYKQIIHLPSFAAAPGDQKIMDIMGMIIDGPVLMHRRHIGRVTFPTNVTQTTGAHQDFHYIRGTAETYTLWMPAGDCPIELGGLAALRGSHRVGFIQHQKFSMKKYASSGLTNDQLPKGDDVEWHAGDFELGDVLIFHSHTIHKALPNLTKDRLRISIDNRYQREGDAIEPGSMGTHYNL